MIDRDEPTVEPVKHPIVPIVAETPSASQGCGACTPGIGGPVCQFTLPGDDDGPVLEGPDAEVQRLMTALMPCLSSGGVAGARRVRSLLVRPGEVELTLNIGPQCQGAAMADDAFQVLKSLLPETDIYVLHAPA
jgi:hypothetical protein